MRVAQEEIFGPVLCVIKFKTMKEAIEIANNSEYGLVGGVFSADQKICHEVVERVKVGYMAVNTYFDLSYDSPFGGVKSSGYGKDMGLESLDAYLETKTVLYDFK